MKRFSFFFAIFFAATLLVGGCGLFGDDSGGRIVIRLTDAPLDADAITVSIVSCELIDSESGDRELFVLDPAATDINLLDYQGGNSLLIADKLVSLARFDQFRIRIGDSPTITFGEDTQPIHVASGASSGIKFFLDEPLELNGATFDVTLDFDAQESVVALGPSEAPSGWVMTPVIRPVSATANGAELTVSDGQADPDGA